MELTDFQEIIKDNQVRNLPQFTPRSLKIECVAESAIAIIGGRRCGKTYRCYQFMHDLREAGTSVEAICRVQFNDLRLSRLTINDLRLIDSAFYTLYPSFRHSQPVFFIFDEIQRIDGWEDYILYLLDDPGHRVLITGSTSKLLSGDIASALRGKCHSQQIFGFSFREFVNHLKIPEDTISSSGKTVLQNAFSRYLVQGSYPGLFKFEQDRHVEILQEYWETMLLKDIIEAHAKEERVPFGSLRYFAQSLVARTARPFTVRKLMQEMHEAGMGCSPPTAYNYLHYLQEAFVIDAISIFTESTRIRQRHYQKSYPLDWAMAAAVNPTAPISVSRKLETMVYIELKRRRLVVNYLQTRTGGEIDFIASDKSGRDTEIIQVCQSLSDENSHRELAALPNAARFFGTDYAQVVTLWEENEFTSDGITIRVVPAWKWLLDYPRT